MASNYFVVMRSFIVSPQLLSSQGKSPSFLILMVDPPPPPDLWPFAQLLSTGEASCRSNCETWNCDKALLLLDSVVTSLGLSVWGSCVAYFAVVRLSLAVPILCLSVDWKRLGLARFGLCPLLYLSHASENLHYSMYDTSTGLDRLYCLTCETVGFTSSKAVCILLPGKSGSILLLPIAFLRFITAVCRLLVGFSLTLVLVSLEIEGRMLLIVFAPLNLGKKVLEFAMLYAAATTLKIAKNLPLHHASVTCKLVSCSLIAEDLALKAALIAAIISGFRCLICSSDPVSLVTLLTNGVVNELKSLLHDISCLSEDFTSILFVFISNLADCLPNVFANYGLVMNNSSS
ncbi:hypothetical protein AALP_AA7G159000 [Arabis alpina]|uniref:RNase H type-1 domain-containing protein n=1 Tax=Arabis alpina TaxID=50452 RepID=A0A087GIC9_ARAAL|nr:hypothetical protein AALP_AA7G159000 [Arabis alpina]